MRRAIVNFSYSPNDNALIRHAVEMGNGILEAAGGKPRYVVPDTAHLMGGCRMGDDPSTSVVNDECRAHDVPNLYICSAAVFPTSGGGIRRRPSWRSPLERRTDCLIDFVKARWAVAGQRSAPWRRAPRYTLCAAMRFMRPLRLVQPL